MTRSAAFLFALTIALAVLFGGASPIRADWVQSGTLPAGRWDHASVTLADGKVLVVGGWTLDPVSGGQIPPAVGAIYDPSTGWWTSTSPMPSPHVQAVPVRLANGDVLVFNPDGTSQVYVPSSDTWRSVGLMVENRTNVRPILMANDRVLVAGGGLGIASDTAEVFNPVTEQWTAVAPMPSPRSRPGFTMVDSNGRVLISGGLDGNGDPALTSVLYDATSNVWIAGPSSPALARSAQVRLADGRYLVVGGEFETTAYVFDPASGVWSTKATPAGAYADGQGFLLSNGKPILARVDSVEVYDVDRDIWYPQNLPADNFNGRSVGQIGDGRILVSGGFTGEAKIESSVFALPPAPTVASFEVQTPYQAAVDFDLTQGLASTELTIEPFVSQGPSNGTATYSGTYVNYRPATGFHGTDTLRFGFVNAAGASAVATVTIRVAPPPPPPIAGPMEARTKANTLVEIELAQGQTGGGAPLEAEIVGGPDNGGVWVSGTKAYYTPDTDFFGTAKFLYRLTNLGGASSAATVTVSVVAVPVPRDITVSTIVGVPVTIDLIKGAGGSRAETARRTSPSVLGTVEGFPNTTVTFKPAANQQGTGSFNYRLVNFAGESEDASVSITVNQPPPVAKDVRVVAKVNVPTLVNLAAGATGSPTSARAVGTPSFGSVTGWPSWLVTFTPPEDRIGTATFRFNLCNFQLSSQCVPSNTATATVAVVPLLVSLDDPVSGIRPAGELLSETSVGDVRAGLPDDQAAVEEADEAARAAARLGGEAARAGPALVPYYTVATAGGRSGKGAVLKLSPPTNGRQWTSSVIYSFAGGTDGATPVGNLVRDARGRLYGVTTAGGGSANAGTVYQLTPPTQAGQLGTIRIVHRFAGPNGRSPVAGLIMGPGGVLYGTTNAGGPANMGTVFRLVPNADGSVWTYQSVYAFRGGADGASPSARLTIDQAGNLYGTTNSGGASGRGTVFRIAPSGPTAWQKTILYSFRGGSDGANPLGHLVRDAAGNLYGTTFAAGTASAGPSGGGTVFRLAPGPTAWTVSVLHSFRGPLGDGANPKAGLVMQANGTLLGTTLRGGVWRRGTMFKLVPNAARTAWTMRIVYSFGGFGDAADPSAGVTLDPSGRVLGPTSGGGEKNNGAVFVMKP